LLFGSLIHISFLQLQNIWCAHFDKGFWILERYFLWRKLIFIVFVMVSLFDFYLKESVLHLSFFNHFSSHLDWRLLYRICSSLILF
jgi:hypothetical protein